MEKLRSFTSHSKNRVLGTKLYIKSKSSSRPGLFKITPEPSKISLITDSSDSLGKLKYFLKSAKPYKAKRKIRDKMQKIKQEKYSFFKNFYTISLKNQQNNKKIYSYTERNKVLKTSPLINNKNFYNENFINSTRANTYYSSFPSEISKNHFNKEKYSIRNIKTQSEKKPYESLTFSNMKPYYKKRGLINEFVDNVRISIKDKFQNKDLKFSQYKMKRNLEIINEKMKIELYQKEQIISLWDKYLDEYHNYENKINKAIEHENDINDNLRWIKLSLKMDINRLALKIQKCLIRISRYAEVKNYLIQMQNFSLKQYDATYQQLVDMKNELMQKTSKSEKILNRQIIILNSRELNLKILHKIEKEKEKDSCIDIKKSFFRGKDNNKNNSLTLEDCISAINKIMENIGDLLIKHSELDQKIVLMKTSSSEELTSYKYKSIDENKNAQMCNEKMLELKNLKEKNKELIIKKNKIIEKIRSIENKNEKNKIRLKAYNIFNQLSINNLISRNELFVINTRLSDDSILDTLIYLRVIEIKTNTLIAIKKDVLIKYPEIIKKVEKECFEKAVIKARFLEKLKSKIIANKTYEKITKKRIYFNRHKDYYHILSDNLKKKKFKVNDNSKNN